MKETEGICFSPSHREGFFGCCKSKVGYPHRYHRFDVREEESKQQYSSGSSVNFESGPYLCRHLDLEHLSALSCMPDANLRLAGRGENFAIICREAHVGNLFVVTRLHLGRQKLVLVRVEPARRIQRQLGRTFG
jgi:hypothetical protein